MFTQDVCFLPESGRFHCAVQESAYDPPRTLGAFDVAFLAFAGRGKSWIIRLSLSC